MNAHHSRAGILKHVSYELIAVIALTALAIIITGFATVHHGGFVSPEVKFTDASKSGLAIVPASCPSSPHFSGECDTTPPAESPNSNTCSLTASQYSIAQGQSVTLGWNTNVGPWPNAYASGSIAPDVGPVAQSGSTTVTPPQTTTYVFTFYIGTFGVTGVPGSCEATITVNGQNSCQSICSGDNLVDSCTGALVQSCACGSTTAACQTQQTQCSAICSGSSVVDSCTGSVIQACTYGCAGTSCNPECSAHYFCSGDALYYGDNSYNYCSSSQVQACTWGCGGSSCNQAPAPQFVQFTAIGPDGQSFTTNGELTAKPLLLASGSQSTLYWNATYVTGCVVTGNDGESFTGTTSGTYGHTTSTSGASGVKTADLFGQTVYTLSCRGYDGSTIGNSVTVNIIPTFEEK